MEAIERTLSYLLQNCRGFDAKLFSKSPAFADFPTPTLTVTSPDCGPSPATMSADYTVAGAGIFPSLSWSLPDSIPESEVAEYLIVCQDADVPIPEVVMHGAWYHILPSVTAITPADMVVVEEGANMLAGGFKYAKNLMGSVYIVPGPMRGHGPHRYFFLVVALKEGLGGKLSARAKKSELMKACEGKVLGWGEWIGVAERK